MRRAWSESETRTLKGMWADGRTGSEIAKALDRSRSSVLGKLGRLGLFHNPSVQPVDRTHWHCGHPATPENTKPGTKGLRCLTCIEATAERNRKIAADYIGGMMQPQIAEKYGLSRFHVRNILKKRGVFLTERERNRRLAANRSPRAGRRKVWPDCPPHLKREYSRLRHNYGYRAADARQMLEAQA